MERRAPQTVAAWVLAPLGALAAHPVAQREADQPGHWSTQVATDGPEFWVYTIDTTTGRAWFLDRQRDGAWERIDDGAAPNDSGPVGKYQLVAFANDKGARI